MQALSSKYNLKILVALICVVISAFYGCRKTYSLHKGKLLNASNEAGLANVKVQVLVPNGQFMGPQTYEEWYNTTTDENGDFKLNLDKNKNYWIRFDLDKDKYYSVDTFLFYNSKNEESLIKRANPKAHLKLHLINKSGMVYPRLYFEKSSLEVLLNSTDTTVVYNEWAINLVGNKENILNFNIDEGPTTKNTKFNITIYLAQFDTTTYLVEY